MTVAAVIVAAGRGLRAGAGAEAVADRGGPGGAAWTLEAFRTVAARGADRAGACTPTTWGCAPRLCGASGRGGGGRRGDAGRERAGGLEALVRFAPDRADP